MFAIIAMTTFILIAVLGFFHAISAQTTAWCFVAWFAVLVVHSQVSNPFKGHSIFEERAEPDLDNAFPLGKSHVVSPPQGGDATIPVQRELTHGEMRQWALQAREVTGGRQRNTALLSLMKMIEQEIEKRKDNSEMQEKSDSKYDEPQATYPEMTMEQKG